MVENIIIKNMMWKGKIRIIINKPLLKNKM